MEGLACKKPSAIAGNGLFANDSIEAGELIACIPRPLIAVLDPDKLDNTCSNCFFSNKDASVSDDSSKKLSACAGCKTLKYCSKVAFGRSSRG